jgi:elongation factor P
VVIHRKSGKTLRLARCKPIFTENGSCLRVFFSYALRLAFWENQRIDFTFMATANDLRRGMAIIYNGDITVVLDMQHRTPGNLRAFVQATLRSIKTGKSSDVRFSSTERIEPVPMITKKMEFSYKDGEDFVFTDPENYETVTLAAELVGDAKNFLVENASVTVTFVENKAVTVELPSSVVLTVTDAPEGIRGDSANNVQKAIIVETGITVQAPLFIKTGEKIKVDTRTGKYMERA